MKKHRISAIKRVAKSSPDYRSNLKKVHEHNGKQTVTNTWIAYSFKDEDETGLEHCSDAIQNLEPATNPQYKEAYTVTLDKDQLLMLIKCFGSREVTLTFNLASKLSPVKMEGDLLEESGVIMPLRT